MTGEATMIVLRNFLFNGKNVKFSHFLEVKIKPKHKTILISNY